MLAPDCLYLLPSSLYEMHARSAESVDVAFLEAMPAAAECSGVGAAVLFNNIQFENRPLAEFIELESWLGHASVSN
jgi:hypothetical protein